MLTLLAQTTQPPEPSWFSQYGLPLLCGITGSVVSAVITAIAVRRIEFRRFRKEQLWQRKIQKYDEIISLLVGFAQDCGAANRRLENNPLVMPTYQAIAILLPSYSPFIDKLTTFLLTASREIYPDAITALEHLLNLLTCPLDVNLSLEKVREAALTVTDSTATAIGVLMRQRENDCG